MSIFELLAFGCASVMVLTMIFRPVELASSRSCLSSFLSRREISLVVFFLFFFFLIGLVSIYLPPIGGSSEAREAHVIQLMGENHDYILPLRNGIVPSKPPLYHWLGTVASKVLGEYSPFSARFPSLISGLCMALLTMVCAVRFSTESGRRINLLLWSVTILAANYLFLKMTTVSMVDAVFSGMITVAVGAIVISMAGDESRKPPSSQAFTIFYLFSGFAVLAKGPAGLFLSGSFLLFLLLARYSVLEAARILLRPRIGWLVFLLVAVPWYFFAAMRQADAFLGKQLIFENVSRFLGGEHITLRPWWFYVPAFLRELAPWSILFIVGAWRAWKETSMPNVSVSSSRTIVRGIYGAVIFIVFVFSCAKGKRESYLLPLVPWLSVALAVQLEDFIRGMPVGSGERLSRIGKRVWCGWLALTLLAALLLEISAKVSFVFSRPIAVTMQQWAIEILFPLSLLIVFAIVIIPLTIKILPERGYVAIARLLSVCAVCSMFLTLGWTIKNLFKNFEPVADSVRRHVREEPLQVVRALRDEFFDGVLYYLRRPVTIVDPDYFPASCEGYALVRFDHWQEWQKSGVLARAQVVEVLYELDDYLMKKEQNQKVLLFCAKNLPVR